MKSNQLQSPYNVQKVDVHCHLFNKKIASIPLLLDLIKSIMKSNRQVANDVCMETDGASPASQVKRISRLLKLLLSKNEDRLIKYLLGYEPDALCVPLMFDLKYAVESKEALETLRQMKVSLQEELDTVYSENQPDRSPVANDRNDEDGFEDLFNEIDRFIVESQGAADQLETNSFGGDTFDEQYRQLMRLRDKHACVIKPFFAVDPRRPDVFERMKQALETDGFGGVKLYCPNGYSPLDPRLDKVYHYCVVNDVPVTAHCSYGGFATLENRVVVQGAIYQDNQVKEYSGLLRFNKRIVEAGGIEERALALNHPDLWAVVLGKYPRLRLNLAHAGVRGADDIEERHEWSRLIFDLMLRNENLYTDFSCNSSEASISHLWRLASEADACHVGGLKVTDRVMFGTDFWLNMLFIGMDQYMNSFRSAFAGKEEDLVRIQTVNPRRFLKM